MQPMKLCAICAALIVIGGGCSDSSSPVTVTFNTAPSRLDAHTSPTTSTTATSSNGRLIPTNDRRDDRADHLDNDAGSDIGCPGDHRRARRSDRESQPSWVRSDSQWALRGDRLTGPSSSSSRAGRLVIMNDGQPGATALDMTDLTSANGEQGLLGLAINADGTMGYVDYTDNNGDTAIDEYVLQADGTFDPATRRTVLAFDQPYPNHNGGEVAFGPDHMLYVGTGDGGSANDPQRRALNVGEWLGKILRIDPRPGDGAYTVPPDNPFVGVEGARPRSGRSASATRGGSASIDRPGICGSPMSGRTSGKRSTSPGWPTEPAAE